MPWGRANSITGTTTYWSNDGSSTAGSQPTNAVTLTVTKGLYSVLLGDTTVTNMTAVPNSVFNNSDVRLRVWFNDGTNGSQLLTPDQRIAAVGYAMMAGNVQDGAITAAKIATGAVGGTQLATGAVQSANIANGAVGGTQLAAGAVGSTQLATGAVQSANIANGAVGTTQLADLSVTGSKLRLGTEAGTAADGVLTVTPGTLTFTRTFSYPFTSPPAVSLLSSGWVPGAVSATNFAASIPFAPVTPDSGGIVGNNPSLVVINGSPAIAYNDGTNGDLKFVRATNAAGTAWGTPVTLDSTGQVGYDASLAVINGNPAISYYDLTNHHLKYIRATDASGTVWGTPAALHSTDPAGGPSSLAVVNGTAAIAYQANSSLKYIIVPELRWQATDGTTAPIIAANVAAGAIGNTQLAANAVQGTNIASGAVGSTQVAAGAIGSSQLASGAAVANLNASNQTAVPSGGIILSLTENPTVVNAGYIKIGTATTTSDAWQQLTNGATPIGRFNFSAVWTGSEMIVWGGLTATGYLNGGNSCLNDGGRYNPAGNTWAAVSPTAEPTGRDLAGTVWTGSEMLIWGGHDGLHGYVGDGGCFNPATNSWRAMSPTNEPGLRGAHTAVWTGTEMIVWGGWIESPPFLNDGGRYNPTSNSWTALNLAGAPAARRGHSAVWTGTQMIIWGGTNTGVLFNDTFSYSPGRAMILYQRP